MFAGVRNGMYINARMPSENHSSISSPGCTFLIIRTCNCLWLTVSIMALLLYVSSDNLIDLIHWWSGTLPSACSTPNDDGRIRMCFSRASRNGAYISKFSSARDWHPFGMATLAKQPGVVRSPSLSLSLPPQSTVGELIFTLWWCRAKLLPFKMLSVHTFHKWWSLASGDRVAGAAWRSKCDGIIGNIVIQNNFWWSTRSKNHRQK